MTSTVFSGGQIFDGTGAAPQRGDIRVEHGRIVEIGTGLGGDLEIDVTGKTLFPGFFDCHVHVTMTTIDTVERLNTPLSYRFYQAIHNMQVTLDAGITSVRDASGADLGVKQAVDNGLVAGPRMQISIAMLSQTGGHGDGHVLCGAQLRTPYPGAPSGVVDGPDEMRKRVRELIREGASVIKVATSGGVLSPVSDPRRGHLRDAELEVLVEEATAAGLHVMAHAQATDGIKAAIRSGIRSIEHGIYLDDEAIQMMLDRGTYLVPTLLAPRMVVEAADSGSRLSDRVLEKVHMVIEAHTDSISRAIDAGVKIAMGTDSGVGPHGQNLRELGLMVDAGLTPTQALVATTKTAAELLGVEDDLGTIQEGKLADLVVVDGDPLDVSQLQANICGVYKSGELVAGG
ncbi:MAG: amidohydrolase family protein [Acidimicrobiales bacterium]|nr:amidohydrolase family protein [Acidimicrobiales bacterium]MDG2218239.1 amidohydrolase family protein [Acidimicrobiales bacterium]